MILTIIFALCSFLCIPAYKLWEKNENLSFVFWIVGLCSVLGAGICIPSCFIAQSNFMTQKRQDQWSAKYTGLEQRIENWEGGDHTDAMLWADVQKYNNDLIHAKYWNDNAWVGWLNERACQEFKTIDIPAYEIEEGK
mgnify:CR=1 FL=1